MPKENRKRGVRGSKKRKREDDYLQNNTKKYMVQDGEGEDVEFIVDDSNKEAFQNGDEYVTLDDSTAVPNEIPFYGLLDEQEQEYFKQADSLLELNQFGDANDRNVFLDSVFREAQGKELKIANSQSCSRLLERLVAASTPAQLKSLWTRFDGHFLHLFQHRFASHCCEALFRRAAPLVGEEIKESRGDNRENGPDAIPEEDQRSIEELFLSCWKELEGNFGFIITDRFASHPFRLLLVILAGVPLKAADAASLLQSKKKESNYKAEEIADEPSILTSGAQPVPASFLIAVNRIINDTIKLLDTSGLRALATHPIANPVLQLFLLISLTSPNSKHGNSKDQSSLLHKIFPEEAAEAESDSTSFVNFLIYEPIGSRLVEILVSHSPKKTFKRMYTSTLRERLPSMARNDIASFVVIKVLERLKGEELKDAMTKLCEESTQRVKHAVLRTLIERCHACGLQEDPLAEALKRIYGEDDNARIDRMLHVGQTAAESSELGLAGDKDAKSNHNNKSSLKDEANNQTQASLLAQTMLSKPGPLRSLITDSLLTLSPQKLQTYSRSRPTSQIIQTALLPQHDKSPIFRRKFVPMLFQPSPDGIENDNHNKEDNDAVATPSHSILIDLATHPIASHLLDALLEATKPITTNDAHPNPNLTHLRDRIARELLDNEARIKDTVPGRAVWRNWNMDVFKRTGMTHTIEPRTTTATAGAHGNLVGVNAKVPRGEKREKTALELARERFARERDRKMEVERKKEKRGRRKA